MIDKRSQRERQYGPLRRNTFQQRVDERTREHKRLLEKVLVFEEASGIDIRQGWSLDSLGKALATFLKDPDQFRERLKRDRLGLVRMLEITDEILGS